MEGLKKWWDFPLKEGRGEAKIIDFPQRKIFAAGFCLKITSKQNNYFNDFEKWMGPAATYFC